MTKKKEAAAKPAETESRSKRREPTTEHLCAAMRMLADGLNTEERREDFDLLLQGYDPEEERERRAKQAEAERLARQEEMNLVPATVVRS